MISTNQTSLVALFGQDFAEFTNLDPNHELELTDLQRKDLQAAAAAAFEIEADKILAPYGCHILADGEIIRSDVNDDTVSEWDQEDVKEKIGMIDISYVIDELDN